MDVKDLKKIVEIMNDNDLAELEIEEEGRRLRLRKAETPAPVVAPVQVPVPPAPAPAPTTASAAETAPRPTASEAAQTIKAPMVGTFYAAPAPDAGPYVSVGDRVGPDTVVCILEAMKVMNEIKADCSGQIVKICVQNGEAVEYDQPLFIIEPS